MQRDTIKDDKIKTILTYGGSLGTSPISAFNQSDTAIDHFDNFLVVVPDDEPIHLLDKTYLPEASDDGRGWTPQTNISGAGRRGIPVCG